MVELLARSARAAPGWLRSRALRSAAPINTELQPTDDDVVMTTGSRLRGDRSASDRRVIVSAISSMLVLLWCSLGKTCKRRMLYVVGA